MAEVHKEAGGRAESADAGSPGAGSPGGGAPGAGSPGAGALAAGTVDLLGVLAYGELSAFDRMAQDARGAPTLEGRAALAGMAAAEMAHYEVLAGYLGKHGVSVEEAMEPFAEHFDAFHTETAPKSWLESLVKAYVGDGLAADFYREIADWVDGETRDVVLGVLADTGHSEFARHAVGTAITDDTITRDRLALWGRRLLGEATTQAQYVVGERDGLAELILTGTEDISGIVGLFRRLQQSHARRMRALGLG